MQILKSLKNLDTLKIRLLCLFLLVWSVLYVQITELLTFDKNLLSQKQSKNTFLLLSICGICLIVFYLCRKQDSKDPNYADIVWREKVESLRSALEFARWLQKPEYVDDVLEGLTYKFKKDFLEGGFYWAKYMLWRDNVGSLIAFIRAKVIKFLS